jgi:uncharacterized protein YukE
MASGFSIADFFAQLSIKADTKEVKKIEDSLNRINKSLKMIGANSVAQANKMDTAFSGDALKRQRLAIQGAHDRLERMGSTLVGFKDRLNNINKASEFLKLKNEIQEATLAQQRFKNELKKTHSTNALLGKENIFKKPDAFTSTKDSNNKALTPFKGGDDFFNRTVEGRRLLFNLTEKQQKQLRQLGLEQEKMGKSTIDATMALKAQAAEMRKINRVSSQTKQKINELTRAQNRMKESARQLATSYLGAFAVLNSVQSINRVGQDFEGMRASMLASSGSAKLAANDLAFVDSEVVRLGLDLKASTDAFSKLQFAAKGKLTRTETKELFTGFSEFATALKVAPEQAKSGLRALQQMLNKTTIMSEELSC